ncbi:armadillo-type protein, partial [Chytridium lagenaria]
MSSLHGAPPTLEIVRAAIKTLYDVNVQGEQREKANTWLDEFQKTPEAWAISDQMLRSQDMEYQELMLAAQNIRKKIIFDIFQLDRLAKEALRDSLLSLLLKAKTLPRPVTSYVCLALADLAILMPEWESPIEQLSYMFSKQEDVGLLLIFIGSLPEECTKRKQVSLQPEEVEERLSTLIDGNAQTVLHMLTVIQNSGIPENLQKEVLNCLSSWITSEAIKLPMLQGTNVVEKAFESLNSESLFDVAVDVICSVIDESGRCLRTKTEPSVFMETVHSIYKGLQTLVPAVSQCEDDEKLRGLCRIFSAAGEAYCNLIIDNLEGWKGIIDGLLLCAECNELEVVGITFLFWSMLAEAITPSSRPHFTYIFRRLMDGMIKHLHYPEDVSAWTGEERDEFREFRHKVGDVLKDCVVILGPEEALSKPHLLLKNFVVAGSGAGALDPNVAWQKIEAPLFAVRTMGDKLLEGEGNALAEIMSMLPQLPSHPKVRYAAILVIGRWARWTKMHPEFLPYQMTYVSKGFEDAESITAASRALKYLCNECGERIVDYLGQLHPFYLNIMSQMEFVERRDLTEALAHVIKHVPIVTPEGGPPNLHKVLEMFCLPTAQRLHELIALCQMEKDKNGIELKRVQREAGDLVAQFAIWIDVVETPDDLGENHPCILIFRSMWPLLSGLLDLNLPSITSAVCKPINFLIKRYHRNVRSLLPEIVPKLAAAYAADPESSSLLWVASSLVKFFGDERDGESAAMYQLVESMSQGAFTIIQSYAGSLHKISYVIEDYFLLLSAFVNTCPTLFVQSPLLPSFVKCAIACMETNDNNAWLALYCRFFRSVFKLASPFWRERRLALAANPYTRTDPRLTPGTPNHLTSQTQPATPTTSPSRPRTPPAVPPPLLNSLTSSSPCYALNPPTFSGVSSPVSCSPSPPARR